MSVLEENHFPKVQLNDNVKFSVYFNFVTHGCFELYC